MLSEVSETPGNRNTDHVGGCVTLKNYIFLTWIHAVLM